MEQELAQYSSRLGTLLENLLQPLVEPGATENRQLENAESYKRYSQLRAERLLRLLDARRDLPEARVLVLENGTGALARLVAARGADVISSAPGETLCRLASQLNPYPSIIYRRFNPLPPEEPFDLVLDSGILPCYPKDSARQFIRRLAIFCKHKMLFEFPLALPWYRRLLRRDNISPCFFAPELPQAGFTRQEILDLVENSCGMLLADCRSEGDLLVFKAIRKAHQNLRR